MPGAYAGGPGGGGRQMPMNYGMPSGPGGPGPGPSGPGGYGPGPSGPGAHDGPGGPPPAAGGPMLNVAGCSNPTVCAIIKGVFAPAGQNHGKPVFKKQGGDPNVSVLIYFWDERDGPNFSGWWFGPKVGGDQVWAYHGDRAAQSPPLAGWKVPWDGPEDPVLRLAQTGGPGGAPPPPPQQPGAPPMGGGSMGMRGPMGHQGGPGAPPGPPQRNPMAAQQEEERRRREAERQRAEDEDRRRREAERQRAMAEQAKRRQEEDDRRRKQMEEDRRRREEEQARRAAEAARKREEEEARRREGAAALAVRKVIQRVRIATPETYDNLRAELEEAQQQHLEAMGSQADRVSQEAQQTLEQTQKRIDDVIRKREEDERKRIEMEQRKKEEAENVERLLKEMKEEVEKIEGIIAEGEEKGKELQALGADATSDDIVAVAEAAQKKAEEVKEVLAKTSEVLSAKQKEMGDNEAAWDAKREVSDMNQKVNTGKRAMDAVVSSASWAKDKAVRKAAALAKLQEQKAAFASHDSDADGKLSRAEVVAFAKAQFEFGLSGEVLDKIMKSLEPVNAEKFRSLFQKVAIAKSEARARELRAEEEKRRKELEERKAAVQKIVQEASDFLSQAEGTCSKAEADARVLARGDHELSASELTSLAESVQKSIVQTRVELEKAVAKTKEVDDACKGEADLEGIHKAQMPRLEQRAKRAEDRAEKVGLAAETAKDLAVKRAYAEVDKKRGEAVAAIRAKMTTDGKAAADFFKEAAGGASDLDKDKFLAMVGGLGESFKLEGDEGDKLFSQIAGAAEAISESCFLELVRMYYKCVKGTVISEDLPIKSKLVRKVEANEVLEMIDGPSKDEASGVERVKCKAANDDATGWVSIASNQGTPFLVSGGNLFSCVKDTVLTDGLSVQDSKTVRRVQTGEVFEVLEFAKKDTDLDLKRVRARAKSDGAMGWITMCGNQGTAYLEVC